jgi:hypothetical protein
MEGRDVRKLQRAINRGESHQFDMKDISSWSTNGFIADGFSKRKLTRTRQQIIFISQREKGAYLGDLSGFTNEVEWILGGKMEIEGMITVGFPDKISLVSVRRVVDEKARTITQVLIDLGKLMQGRPPRPKK